MSKYHEGQTVYANKSAVKAFLKLAEAWDDLEKLKLYYDRQFYIRAKIYDYLYTDKYRVIIEHIRTPIIILEKDLMTIDELIKSSMTYRSFKDDIHDSMQIAESLIMKTKITKSTSTAWTGYLSNIEKGENKMFDCEPRKIIYSNPATIVFWGDGTKTVVKVSDQERFNPYYGFCAALAKKIFGSNAKVNRIVAKGEKRVSGKVLKATENAKKVAAAMMDDIHRELKDKEKVSDESETRTVCFDTFEKGTVNNLNRVDDIRREVKDDSIDTFSIFNDVIKAELRKLFNDKK